MDAEHVVPVSSDEAARLHRLHQAYSVMQSAENRVGGGEGVEGLYGSVACKGTTDIVDCMRDECGLDSSSRLVDIGAGLGRPLVHALVDPGIASGYGVEIDSIKVMKAKRFLELTIEGLQRRGVLAPGPIEAPTIECKPVERISSLDPCTHAYSFWEGVPPEGKAAFGSLFAASRTLRAVAVVQRSMRGQPPAEVMWELGFGRLALVRNFSVSMSGSGRSFQCYVFNRVGHPHPLAGALPAPLPAAAAADSVETPSLPGGDLGAVSGLPAAAAANGDEALSTPPEQAAVLLPANRSGSSAMRRGTRQRRPSTKAAEEEAGSSEEDEAAQAKGDSNARAQRAARRAAAAAEPAAATRKQRGSPAKGASAAAAKSSGGVAKKASPVKKPASPVKPAAAAPAKGSPSKAKAKSRGGLFGGALGSLRQQKAGAALTSGGKPAVAAASQPATAATAASAARRGLLGGLRSMTRSMQQALSPGAARAEVAAGGHAKSA